MKDLRLPAALLIVVASLLGSSIGAQPASAAVSRARVVAVTTPQTRAPNVPSVLRAGLYTFQVVAKPSIGLHSLSLTRPARGYTLAQYVRDTSAHPAREPRAAELFYVQSGSSAQIVLQPGTYWLNAEQAALHPRRVGILTVTGPRSRAVLHAATPVPLGTAGLTARVQVRAALPWWRLSNASSRDREAYIYRVPEGSSPDEVAAALRSRKDHPEIVSALESASFGYVPLDAHRSEQVALGLLPGSYVIVAFTFSGPAEQDLTFVTVPRPRA
ncbi:hypothetical protein EV189_1078 [Motilibacter rhizosphaerae]|uniref:DUF4397 domain-containing protein n=1 Tax=Motilibacter rhizosphaerae TaxID=598652 RepID=A0A4Q7NWV6_9ACTN|nr:hypothetical protein [Motilibacter rhizosphaerae]RZS91826.1 hypothetical protein EV189_1078 [Motilibacter rhizosphaerae]